MKTNNKLMVDTNSACFLCLKTSASEGDEDYRPRSFMEVSRYLQLDLNNITATSFMKENESGELLDEKLEILVPLCNQCGLVVNEFGGLFRKLELIRFKLNANVKTIHEIICNTDKEEPELICATIAENLRKETIEKCAQIIEDKPQYELERNGEEANCEVDFPKESVLQQPAVETILEEDEDRTSECGGSLVLIDSLSLDEDSLKTENDGEDVIAQADENPEERQRFVKCHSCGKRVPQDIFYNHLMTHVGRGKASQCPYCPKSYKDKDNLQLHKIQNHITNIFNNSWNRKVVSFERFEAAINRLLQQSIHQSANPLLSRRFACCMCRDDCYSFKSKDEVTVHLIETHFKGLTLKLREMLYDTKFTQHLWQMPLLK